MTYENLYGVNFEEAVNDFYKKTLDKHRSSNKDLIKVITDIISDPDARFTTFGLFFPTCCAIEHPFWDNLIDSKINLISSINDFLDIVHYNLNDDGFLQLKRYAFKYDSNPNDVYSYIISDIEDDNYFKHQIIDYFGGLFSDDEEVDLEVDSIVIKNTAMLVDILKETTKKENYGLTIEGDDDDVEHIDRFDEDKAFSKYFKKDE